MTINYWFLSRAKRKLDMVPEMLRVFAETAEGRRWKGNREVQARFEQAMRRRHQKKDNVSESASGARTYVVLLYMLGFYYEDEKGVHITPIGKDLINGGPEVPILSKQILDFQYPSPYSIQRNVSISRDFRIQPHRFILRLFLEKGFTEITQHEIGFCLAPFAKRNEDLDKAAEQIKRFRNSPQVVIREAKLASHANEENLKDVGNTFLNHLEITGLFATANYPKRLIMYDNQRSEAERLLKRLRPGLIPGPEFEAAFQMEYGRSLLHGNDRSLHVTRLKLF